MGQHGNVLDILVTSRRDTKAATRFFRKLLKSLEYVPRVVVTDKLGSYPAARRRVARSVEHRQSKYLNIRVENSHQPTRQRERAMKRFTSPGHAQRFLSAFRGWFQSVMATQCSAISLSKTSIGFCQPSVLRGLPFSSAATLSSSSWVCKDRSVPFGKY